MNQSKKEGLSRKGAFQKPPQTQSHQPGNEFAMRPRPVSLNHHQIGSQKLIGKVALVTGGDSGIGRACALAFAKEGASIAIVYLREDQDAEETSLMIEKLGQKVLLVKGDIRKESFCRNSIKKTIQHFGKINILVNNAAAQYPQDSLNSITKAQLEKTFQTNIFPMFYLSKAALPYLKKNKGSTIINTTSVTAYRGSPHLIDYSATKGAIVSFTRSLALNLAEEGIRVNAVAPGPIWTPLIPATFSKKEVSSFGSETPLGRPGEPWECAGSYVFLASSDSSYMTGQVLHPNGGEIING